MFIRTVRYEGKYGQDYIAFGGEKSILEQCPYCGFYPWVYVPEGTVQA